MKDITDMIEKVHISFEARGKVLTYAGSDGDINQINKLSGNRQNKHFSRGTN